MENNEGIVLSGDKRSAQYLLGNKWKINGK